MADHPLCKLLIMNWWVQLSKAVLREGPEALLIWRVVVAKKLKLDSCVPMRPAVWWGGPEFNDEDRLLNKAESDWLLNS